MLALAHTSTMFLLRLVPRSEGVVVAEKKLERRWITGVAFGEQEYTLEEHLPSRAHD